MTKSGFLQFCLPVICSQSTAAQEQGRDDEPAMDLSATFRQSLRLNMPGATPLNNQPDLMF